MSYFKKNIIVTAGTIVIGMVIMGLVAADLAVTEKADRPLAFVRKFKPDIYVKNQGPEEKANKANPLYSGDTLRTDDSGFALVQFMDKSIAKVKPSSRLVVRGEVTGKNNTSARISLEAGEIFLNVIPRTTSDFEVATETSVATVKGTQFGANSSNYFWVIEGVVGLFSNNTGQSVDLKEKMFGQVNDDGSIETGELTDEELENLNEGYDELEGGFEEKVIKLRFRDENGQIREIELKYYEN